MIVTKNSPFTTEEIDEVKKEFEFYIKTVIDLEKKICSAGSNRHADSEKILLEQGSKQDDLWGGGIDLDTMTIDFNSFINIRPFQGNTSNEIQNEEIRKEYESITKFFFQKLYE